MQDKVQRAARCRHATGAALICMNPQILLSLSAMGENMVPPEHTRKKEHSPGSKWGISPMTDVLETWKSITPMLAARRRTPAVRSLK